MCTACAPLLLFASSRIDLTFSNCPIFFFIFYKFTEKSYYSILSAYRWRISWKFWWVLLPNFNIFIIFIAEHVVLMISLFTFILSKNCNKLQVQMFLSCRSCVFFPMIIPFSKIPNNDYYLIKNMWMLCDLEMNSS